MPLYETGNHFWEELVKNPHRLGAKPPPNPDTSSPPPAHTVAREPSGWIPHVSIVCMAVCTTGSRPALRPESLTGVGSSGIMAKDSHIGGNTDTSPTRAITYIQYLLQYKGFCIPLRASGDAQPIGTAIPSGHQPTQPELLQGNLTG